MYVGECITLYACIYIYIYIYTVDVKKYHHSSDKET